MAKLSRRDFLKSSGAAALSIAALGLTGCTAAAAGESDGSAAESTTIAPETAAMAPETTAAVPETTAAAPAGGMQTPQAEAADKIWTAYVNPQREDYRTNTKELKTLFSPLKIGAVEIGHRMVKSAAGSATYLAGLTDELLQYYVNLAKGGLELIYVEGIAALEIPADGSGYSAETLAFGKKLVEECAQYGASLGYQWAQFGGGENDMTADDIHGIQDRGVAIAKGMQELGFKAFEINAAGFNMGEHFLSRFYNTRTDEYGCTSLENRARFVTECIEKIKAECGADFNVQILIDAIEENDNITNNPTLMTLDNYVTVPHTQVTTVEEGIEFAKLFEKAGADSMHLRLGPLGHHVAQFGSDLYFILNGIEGATGFGMQYDFKKHWQGQLIGDTSGAGMLLDVAARYKAAVSIPCGAVTYMDPAHAPDFFEQALEDGKVDFFLMTRPLTVDMEYVNKLREGRIDEIAPCTRCLHCHIGSNELNSMFGYCRVNALTQRVMRENGPATYELPAAEKAKKVMVIGGGPAGMEAARIAASRGHDVTLYEKKGMLGGLLDFAHIVKGPHENLLDLKNYLIRQLDVCKVKVETGVEVDAAKIAAEAPDAVILAAGGLRDTLNVAGDGNTPVIDMESFMFTEMGENVIVYGSNAQAFDAALWLTVHKKHVTMVTPNKADEMDMQQSQHAMRMMTTALYSLGFHSWPQSSIKSVNGGVATITTETGVDMEIPCDAIVNAADMLPNKSLLDGISVSEVYAVGDCEAPFNIAKAIHAGNDAGRAV
ncbi:MAG: FAD-dependent oxidoreductase [Lachnospiraceae bacterium]|jgi:2,4-dienoyl-CoA reductase-like NADH-dependent reductase (Old Yellow Enzyme family)/thioredoxin reductase|nr:FAD-dependent oxidoreductase [Lachnospiraceae bacterium]